jgi:hypothetical protein
VHETATTENGSGTERLNRLKKSDVQYFTNSWFFVRKLLGIFCNIRPNLVVFSINYTHLQHLGQPVDEKG